MKISFAFCLVLLIITVLQQGSSYQKRGNQGEELLLFDNINDDECCHQNGRDVIMKKPGLLEIILDGGNELVFEVCSMNCDGDLIVCYESESSNQNVLQLCDTKCGFYVTTQNNSISLMEPITSRFPGQPKKNECESIVMTDGHAFFRNDSYPSCSPKIAENGLVKLNVLNATSDCSVKIKNATIKPKTTTAPPTISPTAATGISNGRNSKSNGSGNGTTEAPGTFLEKYWWIFLIIGLFVVALIVAAGIVIYCLKCKKSKKPAPTQPVAAPRTIQDSKSPVVLQASAEPVKSRNIPTSILEPSSIISRKSVLEMVKKEEEVKQDETDLASMKPTA